MNSDRLKRKHEHLHIQVEQLEKIRETDRTPETKQRIKLFSALKSKLFTIAPTSQLRAKDASCAVLAVFSRTWTFKELSNLLRASWALLTGSLFNKSSIQLLIVCKILITLIKIYALIA